MNLQFGTGVIYMLPNSGNTAANPTPYRLAALQSGEVDFKAQNKQAFGQNQFPIASARGQIAVTGKATVKAFDPGMLNQLYFGQSSVTGGVVAADQEAATIPSETTYTATVANAATFATDYGVQFSANCQQLTKVASNPAAGQYSEAAGVYTFAAADAGKGVKISYTYTATDTSLLQITLSNQLMGFAPAFRMLLSNTFGGKRFAIELNKCVLTDFTVPTKQDDFWQMELSFDAFTDDSDTLGTIVASLQ